MQERNQRPTKAELEEDEFLTWVLNAGQYIKDRAQLFLGGVVAIVAVIVIASFLQTQQAEARQRASAMLFETTVTLGSGQVDQGVRLGQQLIDEYTDTPAAAQAMIVVANRYFLLGRYAEAEALYRQYLDIHGDLEPLVYAARTGLAACREARGDLQGAASDYVAYADENPEAPSSAMALMEAARCYRQLGDAGRSKEILERVLSDHGMTPVAQRAREQLNLMM